ncbi:MAG: DUF882 domain-containing protein [Pseudomonadota bacterium]|nr:MAG: DUF882 domain-containing protein [Pseudomonadota bacterium]
MDQYRRKFLSRLLAGSSVIISAPAWASKGSPEERSLALRNLHTGEHIREVYWSDGGYLEEGLATINHALRDHRSGEVYAVDHNLLDILHLLHRSVEGRREFEVISGYRSPSTNAKLRSKSGGVARRSLHMQGKAIDIRLPGCNLAQLRKAALAMRAGGVGYYPESNFIHVDTGRVRRW